MRQEAARLVTLHHGDALDVLRGIADASVDAVVTDPPYGLSDHALTAFCWCRPQPECGEAGLVWVHHERLAQAAALRVGRD